MSPYILFVSFMPAFSLILYIYTQRQNTLHVRSQSFQVVRIQHVYMCMYRIVVCMYVCQYAKAMMVWISVQKLRLYTWLFFCQPILFLFAFASGTIYAVIFLILFTQKNNYNAR